MGNGIETRKGVHLHHAKFACVGAFCAFCLRLADLRPASLLQKALTPHQSTSAATVLGLSCTLPRVQMYRLYIWKHKYISQICRRGIYYICAYMHVYIPTSYVVYICTLQIFGIPWNFFYFYWPHHRHCNLYCIPWMIWTDYLSLAYVCVSRNKGLHVAFKRSVGLSVCCPFIYGFICGYWIRSSCLSLSAWLISSWQWGVEGPTYPAT